MYVIKKYCNHKVCNESWNLYMFLNLPTVYCVRAYPNSLSKSDAIV